MLTTLNGESVHLLQPHHLAVLEGKTRHVKRLTETNQSMLLLGCFTFMWVGISALFGILSLRDYLTIENRQALQAEGVVIEGGVTGREFDADSENGDRYYLTYRFFVEGVAYTGKDEVSSSVYNEKQPESRLYLRYLPDNPKISAIVDSPTGRVYRNNHQPILYGMSACFNLFGVLMLWGTLQMAYTDTRDQRILKRDGRVLKGEVNQYEVATDSDNDPMGQYLIYTVFIENGKIAKGKVLLSTYRFPDNTLPPVGNSLAIWYAHENLHTPL